MNAKGGVGKSTVTMALAETLSVYHGKRVLLIDSDGQMSLSLMAMSVDRLNALRAQHHTLTALLGSLLPGEGSIAWQACVAEEASDVDGASRLFIIPSEMDMTLLEREIASRGALDLVRRFCRGMLQEARSYVDLVLVDCAPGLSIMTECWLRECDWHLIPTKPDILAVSGIQYLKTFKRMRAGVRFARHLGVAVNMKQSGSQTDEMVHAHLLKDDELACFTPAIPLIPHIQKASLYSVEGRSFQNKYPGAAGQALRALAAEMVQRTAQRGSEETRAYAPVI